MTVLQEVCNRFEVELAHVHHLIGNSAALIDQLNGMKLPVVFSFHDFYTVCPTIQLIDDQGRFCGGQCTPGDGQCPLAPNLFPAGNRPVVKHHYVYQHREEMGKSLRLCNAYVVPSDSVKTLLLRAFPFLDVGRLKIIGHGRTVIRHELAVPPRRGHVSRVVCFGNIDHAKGANLLQEIMALDAAQGRRFEFHFVGNKSREFKPESCGGVYHGPYERDTLPQMIEKIGASFAMIPSICSETFCYTLTEAWAMGLPVLASDIGALKERISLHGGGWRLNYTDPKEWYRRMVEIVDTPGTYELELGKIASIPVKSVAEMSEEYRQLYLSLLNPVRRSQVAENMVPDRAGVVTRVA
jgi:glycosyltransferase involved in cell wall biosynthesis